MCTCPLSLYTSIILYRLAAEDQIHSLQTLVDDTFQQFALDDSEDDCTDDEGSLSPFENSFEERSLIISENGLDDSTHSPAIISLNVESRDSKRIQHVRAQSSQ